MAAPVPQHRQPRGGWQVRGTRGRGCVYFHAAARAPALSECVFQMELSVSQMRCASCSKIPRHCNKFVFKPSAAAEPTAPRCLESLAFPGSSVIASLPRLWTDEPVWEAGEKSTFWANGLETLTLKSQTQSFPSPFVTQTGSLSR